MSIALVYTKFKTGGGTERYMLDLVEGFYKQHNMKPAVYAGSFSTNIPEYQYITPKKINLSIIPKPFRLPFISRFIQKTKHHDEIIIALTQVDADIIICGGQHKGYLNALNKAPSLLEKLKIRNEQKSFNCAKLIIAHSELMKKELIKFYHISQEKIAVIYPPVNTEKFKPAAPIQREEIRSKFGFSTDEVIYLFPSTGHKRKGFDLLKSFFNQSDLPIKLVVVGTPVEESKNVVSLGFRHDMPELYQAADFTIMASQYEPFGLVGIESILSGTPIIFSDNMACLEVLKNNFGLTFQRENKDSLKKAIEQSVLQVKQHQTRIESPLNCISYHPSLETHISALSEKISQVQSSKNHNPL